MDENADLLPVPDVGDQVQQAVQDLEDLIDILGVEGGGDVGGVEGDGDVQVPEDLVEEERRPDIDGDNTETSRIPSVNTALRFISALKSACLEDDKLDPEVLERLRHPLEEVTELDDPDIRLSVDLFLADTNGSEKIYNESRAACLRRHPTDKILSHHLVKKKVAELSGITSIIHDMCPNTCVAYTGPFADLDKCPLCYESRYDEVRLASTGMKEPRQQFHTFPLGPQCQARYRSPEGASSMHYFEEQMETILAELRVSGKLAVFEDVLHGADCWDAYQHGRILPGDIVVMFSMDGAQLYKNKASDCWIYIWILLNLAPDKRYKKRYVMPGAIIPGPNKPKNTDSFMYPGLHHVAALQKEGFRIWDASRRITKPSRPWIFLVTADAVGASLLHGGVGHHGKKGCREGCARIGRRKPGGSHYYAACLKPDNYNEDGCNHGDDEPANLPVRSPAEYQSDCIHLQQSTSIAEYERRRLETGISRPSIFSGMPSECRLPIPGLFPGDIMHLIGLNIPDLLLKLWRGTIECDRKNGDNRDTWNWVCLVGDVWKRHGQDVANARRFLPGSFDRPPRNPAEKISSGYKCWEFLHYIYGLGPGILHGILPDKYWQNFCKLAAGARIIFQLHIPYSQLLKASTLLADFVYDFETLYVERKISRLHFVPQCMHAITHTPGATFRIGPLACSSQFPMERTIGDLGAEIKQPSNPFANLAERALRRAQVNALNAMYPDLVVEPSIVSPNMQSHDLHDGFILLHPRQDRPRPIRFCEAEAIQLYIEGIIGHADAQENWSEDSCVRRWGRVCLPNRQIVRTAWKEITHNVSRMNRNVKVSHSGISSYRLLKLLVCICSVHVQHSIEIRRGALFLSAQNW